MTYTTRMTCPRCGSVDCNHTTEDLGKMIVADVRTSTVYCNACTYSKVALIVNNREVVTETRVPEYDDTEIEYKFLGQERG